MKGKGAIERIVVPLDVASDNRTALDTAARLAARVNAPLHGVFIESEDLLHLAALPFARHVTAGAGAQPFTRAHAELHLQAAAERARKELAAAAHRHRVKSSFEVVRGGSATVLSAATTARDVVVAGSESRPVAGHFRMQRGLAEALTAATGPFLLARQSWTAGGLVVVLLRERSAAAERLLTAAAQVAQARGGGLTVICPAALAGAADFEKWLADRLATLPAPVEIEVLPAETGALQERLIGLECRVLAIEAGTSESAGERFLEFTRRFTCDVLLVR